MDFIFGFILPFILIFILYKGLIFLEKKTPPKWLNKFFKVRGEK